MVAGPPLLMKWKLDLKTSKNAVALEDKECESLSPMNRGTSLSGLQKSSSQNRFVDRATPAD